MKMIVKGVYLESSKDEGWSEPESADMEEELFIRNPGNEKDPILEIKTADGGRFGSSRDEWTISALEDGAGEFIQSPAQERKKRKMENYKKVIARHGREFGRLHLREDSKKGASGGKDLRDNKEKFARILGQKAPTEH